MKDIISNLNLTNDTIEIFLECMGKIPLSYEEIHSIKPHLSEKEFKIIFDELLKNNLIINVVPEESKIIKHYLAIPPFSAIFKSLLSDQDEEDLNEPQLKSNIRNIIIEIFKEKDNPIELDSILDELKMMRQNFENDSSDLRKEIHKTLDDMHTRDDSALFYLNFEENVKNSINSQFASILEIILQIDAKSEEIPGIKDLTVTQWKNIKQGLKNYLAKSIHDKAKELDKNISGNFMEIKDYFASKLAISMEEQVGQKAVDLGILKIVVEELTGLFDFIKSKNETFTESWKNLASLIGDKLSNNFKNLINQNLEKIKIIEHLLPEILETYFKIDNTWRITSISKLNEEISNIVSKSNEEIIIIVPKIKDYIPIEILKTTKGVQKIKICASDPHESKIIGEIRSYPNLEYLRIENNKTIGIIGAGILIIGYYQFNEKDLTKKINAYGTIDERMIDLFTPIIINKSMLGKPPDRVQMNNNFNYIIEKINNITGNEISQKLQESLDIATNMKGITLDVLELKLLISKLKKINVPLSDNNLKQNIIEKIQLWNDDFTSLPLEPTPELMSSEDIKLKIEEEEDFKETPLILNNTPLGNFGILDIDKIEPLFELLFEKMEYSNGEEISKLIQDVVFSVLQLQGFSFIRTWKDELNSEEYKMQKLENDFKDKFKEDFTQWKNAILSLVNKENKSMADHNVIKANNIINNEQSIEDEIDLSGYTSPGMDQEQFDYSSSSNINSEVIDGEKLIDNIKKTYDQIFLNLNELKGTDIGNKLQILGDLLVEKHGYMATKEIRPWISKLKKHKDLLEDDLKNQLSNLLIKIKDLYVGDTNEEILSNYIPSFANLIDDDDGSNENNNEDNKLINLFDKIIENSKTFNGYELTADLQEIADIIMSSKGALAARSIRPWISKLRTIREPLEENVIIDFAQYIEEMKEKLCK